MTEPDEFELISRYFSRISGRQPCVSTGQGDDAAVLEIGRRHWVYCTDMLVEGTHFFRGQDPWDIGYKSLAVNLSDIAAMGAAPVWAMLSLSLPSADEAWLKSFSDGLAYLADEHNVALIGGDTTKGSLNICISVGGIAHGEPTLRSSAKAGQKICLSGTIGDAALGVMARRKKLSFSEQDKQVFFARLDRPSPRLELAARIHQWVHASIDVSDGLVADLGHILQQSDKGARIHLKDLPLSAEVRKYVHATGDIQTPLTGGDDYELCITVDKCDLSDVLHHKGSTPLTVIGEITDEPGLQLVDESGGLLELSTQGFQHF